MNFKGSMQLLQKNTGSSTRKNVNRATVILVDSYLLLS